MLPPRHHVLTEVLDAVAAAGYPATFDASPDAYLLALAHTGRLEPEPGHHLCALGSTRIVPQEGPLSRGTLNLAAEVLREVHNPRSPLERA